MKIGIPRGLLYPKYGVFARTFLEEMGAEVVISPKTNKKILDEGVGRCVDDACLPVKVFHGHVSWLRDRCDALLIPRIMGVEKDKYVCPMFCGLNEMLAHSIPGLPPMIDTPVFSQDYVSLLAWAKTAGASVTKDGGKVISAFNKAMRAQAQAESGTDDEGYSLRVALLGHAYNIDDAYVNMDVKKKLNRLGIGVFTGDHVGADLIAFEAAKLFKQPFWTFAREYYGAAAGVFRTGCADGIIYLSSFSCGIDSVVTELIRSEIGDFPFLVLKLDEHTGEAGLDTRIDAFSDMLKRRCAIGTDVS